MSKIRKILLVLLAAVCVASACFAISACSTKYYREPAGGVKDNGSIDPNNPDGDLPFYYPEGIDRSDVSDENAYVINTMSVGGMPINNVRVTVSKNGKKVIEGISQNGGVKFGGIAFDDYDLSYSDLPLGYREDEKGTIYHLNAKDLVVTTRFQSSVIASNMPTGWSYNLGDIMYNFRYTNALGDTMELTTLLQNKKAVVLNFWATWCGPCGNEFPALNRAYTKFNNDIAVLALSTESNDSNQIIETYRNGFVPALSFFMANDNLGLYSAIAATTSVPATIIIDRYGMVAFRHVGSITSDLEWEAMFKQFTDDDYTQQPVQSGGGPVGDNKPVAPPEFANFEPISDNAFNQAFLDASMTTDLHYYYPAEGTNDAECNWPFQVAENALDGMYITPTNIGTYYSPAGEKYGTDNSWAILYTDITLDADQTLTVDVRLNTESGKDVLYIIMNNTSVGSYQGSGQTDGWETVQLYKATRPTALSIAITYTKNSLGAPDGEFVGLKNLKVTNFDPNTKEPVDLRTELSEENADGSYTYKTVYLADDGFYHVQQGNAQNPANDSILFVDIMYETLWTDRHIKNYSLRTEEGQGLTPSLYQVSFWLFGNGSADFPYGKKETRSILDCFYIQDAELDTLTPVNADIRQALEAFASYAFENNGLFGDNIYQNGHNENTWLELCTYYRTLGGDHTAKGHVCKAHTNTGLGKILSYAIDLHDGINTVDTTIAASLNFMNGAFYKLSAYNGAGAYRVKSLRPYAPGDRIDPYILVWGSNSDAYNIPPILEQDDSPSIERFTNYSYNFDVVVYLDEGEFVYCQMTTRAIENPGVYDVEISYLGEEYWQFRVASTGEGQWYGESTDKAVYAAIETALDDFTGLYHHVTHGELASVVYIDFIHANFFDQNQNSLKAMVDQGMFRLGDVDYTEKMNEYYEKAMAKDESDPTYGMVEADRRLVQYLSAFLQAQSGEGMSTGLWKSFAYYYQYFGPSSNNGWNEMPVA